jgi:hypothetical protein
MKRTRKRGRYAREFGMPELVMIGLGSLAGLMLITYLANSRRVIIPPSEPIRLKGVLPE